MEEEEDQDFCLVKKMIHSYVDTTYIENKEEQTIESFRKEVVNHVLSHLNLCGNNHKNN